MTVPADTSGGDASGEGDANVDVPAAVRVSSESFLEKRCKTSKYLCSGASLALTDLLIQYSTACCTQLVCPAGSILPVPASTELGTTVEHHPLRG